MLYSAAIVSLLVGCGDDGPERFVDRRAAEARARACQADGSPPSVEELAGFSGPAPEVVVHDLASFDEPVDLTTREGDANSVFVLEKAGRIHRLPIDGGTPTLVGDISERIETVFWAPAGVLGIEFSPDGRYLFAHYVDRSDRSVIAEFPVSGEGLIDADRERQLLVIQQKADTWHFGGDLAFGPDGMLYIGLGDGDSGVEENGGDPDRVASDPHELLGSMLRIDPAPAADRAYTIPPDNPFADGELGAPEVWAWGLRNPWKFSFDRATGDLWIADVGFSNWEEISLVRRIADEVPGRCANFGWSQFEGTSPLNGDVHGAGHLIEPVHTYGHDVGCSVSGGALYRGVEIPALTGLYVYGDLCFSGPLWAFDPITGRNLLLASGLGELVAVREGPTGELFVIDHKGSVRTVRPG